MNEITKVYSFLGIARKANEIVAGDESCEIAISKNKVKFLIIAEDASENTRLKFERLCNNKKINIKVFGEKVLLGRCIGKDQRSVVAITSNDFAKRICELIDGIKF